MNACYLRLFGSPSVEAGDGNTLTGRVTQRHRVALLALVALAPNQRLTRDKLIGHLWPESDAEHARNLLNVALYNLRKALGEEALLSTGDDLTLNAEVIRSDVAEFAAAVGRGDHADAVALYRGPLLDGFFLSETPEFEQWAEHERNQLAVSYDKSLEALAESAESAQDFSKASEWWKTRAARDPYDSRVALRLMQALAASGNRAAALQHASLHQRLLQSEFGVESAHSVAAYAERLRSEPVTAESLSPLLHSQPAGATSVAPFTAAAATPTLSEPTARRSWRPIVALLALGALATVAWIFWPRGSVPEGSIAVLPFVNLSPNSDNDYFSDGLTEEIITRLAVIPNLKVISRTSAMHYKGSKKPLREIARELNVAHILEGSVRASEGTVRISAQLVDARSDAHLWANSYEYELRTPFRVQAEIAREVARALEVELGDRTRRLLVRRGTSDPEAYEYYRRGRFLWNLRTREAHEQALTYFSRAIARDSNYADAYAGMADVYLTAWQLNLSERTEAEAYSRLKWAAERAIALDDESADAHVSFAIALWWQRNWPGTARELRRAIDLNPGNATARTWYSLLLRGMGRLDEAREEARRGYELDPLAVIPSAVYGWQSYIDRDYDRSLVQFAHAADIGGYAGPSVGVALNYAHKGMFDSALYAVRRAIDLAPEFPGILADLAYVHALAGDTTEARLTLRRAKLEPLEPFNIGRAYVALGEPDSAFAWLERSNWQWPHRAVLSDPALDPLRADPRFARLTARVAREMGIQ